MADADAQPPLRGPRVRYQGPDQDIQVLEFPPDTDAIALLEHCFKRLGGTISQESIERFNRAMMARESRAAKKPWLTEQTAKRKRRAR